MIKKQNVGPEIRTLAPRLVELELYIITTILRGLEVCDRRLGLYLSVYVVFFDKLDSNRKIVGVGGGGGVSGGR